MLLAGILMPTTSFAQSNTLFNPDYNGDGFIGVDDILGALSFYDNAWEGPVSPSWSCGEVITYAGVGYSTVQIGDQCWFAENLRTTTYLNGDAIPQNLSAGDWQGTPSGAMTFYNNGPTYGGLYNWFAVDDARGLCPSGWHVPTDAEWTILTDHLGGEPVAGGQMKMTYGWLDGGNGTNSSGFSGLPGGYRYLNGAFYYAGSDGVGGVPRPALAPAHGAGSCTATARVSSATTTILEAVSLFVAFGIPSERSERVLNS